MHFMPQTGSRYTAAKECQHQLPPVEGEHEGRWSDLPHTISPVILLPLCCPFQLQTLTSIHLDLSLRSLTTVSLNFPQFGFQSSSIRLLSLPLLSHNLQPSGFSVQKSLGSTPIHLRPCRVLNNTNCLWSVRILKR